jgi:hypothetical protein
VKFLAAVLRVYSFVFHLALSAFLLGLAGIAYRTDQPVSLGSLPFFQENAVRDTLILGLLGLTFTLLALTRSFKFLFVVWTLVVVYVMAKVFFLGPYAYAAPDKIRGAAWLTFGAVGAFFGAGWTLKIRKRAAFF